jgi:hypothetical protein
LIRGSYLSDSDRIRSKDKSDGSDQIRFKIRREEKKRKGERKAKEGGEKKCGKNLKKI